MLYSLYLIGSIRLWKKEFKKRYSPLFKYKIKLFEPGEMNIPDDHRLITGRIAQKDRSEIAKSDAVLVYMKKYTSSRFGGPAGTDSSWECGYAYGIKKPIIAIVEDLDHLAYFESQWMLTFHISAYITDKKAVVEKIKTTPHFKGAKVIFCESKEFFEEKICEYLHKKQNGTRRIGSHRRN